MKNIGDLYESNPIIEADDYVAGFMMVSTISGAVPELKAQYLAQWAARLREYYVGVGRDTEQSEEIERLRGLLRMCARGTHIVDLGNGEVLGLHLPNEQNPETVCSQ